MRGAVDAVGAYLEGLDWSRRARAVAELRKVCELALKAGGVLENLGAVVPWPYLRRMMEAGILHEYYRSHRYRMYRLLVPAEDVLRSLDGLGAGEGRPTPVELPEDLFEDIVGHDDVKWLLRRLLTSERPFHVLLLGEPATAKSVTGDTRVVVRGARGVEFPTIEEVYYRALRGEGFEALSVNPTTLKAEWRRVYAVTRHPADRIIVVRTSTGREVKVTPDHSLLTYDFRLRRLVPIAAEELLRRGPRVVPVLRRLPTEELIREVDFMGLRLPLNEELGYFIGLWLAEGTVTPTREYWVTVSSHCGELLELCADCIKHVPPSYSTYAGGLCEGDATLRLLVEADVFWDPIEEVEQREYDGYVYDLSVEGSENFVCDNGIVLHNSFFLMDLERVDVPKVVVLGSSLSKAGLLDLVREVRPRLMLIDELDKVERPRDLAALLSLMEGGRAIKAVKGERWELRLDVRVVAAANDPRRLDEALLDRFIPVYFPKYSREEYLRVATAVLVKREGLSEEEARLVAEESYRRGLSVRQAVLVARASGGAELLPQVLRAVDRRLRLKEGKAY